MASVGTIKYKNGSSWVDILHPVNSFYFSHASTSPSSLFGGTWTQVTGAAIRGNNSVGYTGSDTHTLTTNEIPSHSHWLSGADLNSSSGSTYYALYGGRAPSGGGWNVSSTGGGSTFNRATLLQLLYLVSYCVDRLEVSGNGRTPQI